MGFKVVGKIVKDNDIMGYKVYCGFSIFYITKDLLVKARMLGLIEKQDNQVEVIDYNSINKTDGLAINKLTYALQSTTIDKLKNALSVNSTYTKVDVEIYELGKKIATYRVDASIDSINQLYQSYLLRRDFTTVYSLVDFFCSVLSRQYLNIEDILEYLEEEKGSSVFTCYVHKNGKDNSEIRVNQHNMVVI